MITNILNGNKAFYVTRDNDNIVSIGYDADADGSITADEHNTESGTWDIYADYRNEPEIYKVSGGSFVNPRAVIILTCTQQGQDPDYGIENPTYIEKSDTPAIPSAVNDVDVAHPSLKAMTDGTILLNNCNGYSFAIYDLSGRVVSSFGCDSDTMSFNPGIGKGIFVIQGKSENNMITLKYIAK